MKVRTNTRGVKMQRFTVPSLEPEERGGKGGGRGGVCICTVNHEKYGTLHEFACHPCAGAMLIFSVSFQF
jgi:hypothetical protein